MPEFTEKDQRTIDSLVSGVNFLSSSLSNAKQEIKKQKERIEALLKRIADLEGRTIEAGDGIEVDDYGSSILISADQDPPQEIFPKHIVIRALPVEIPIGPQRYIHANLRLQTLVLSNDSTSSDPEVEVYDKQDIFAPHLTGF